MAENPSVAAVVRSSRSRSGSPCCYDLEKFEKEKSPFLAVKSLLKPIKKPKLLTGGNTGGEEKQNVTDFRKVGESLRPRTSPLSLASKQKHFRKV